MRREIAEGEEIPRFYRVATRDYARRLAICYPFPFHLLINWADRLYWRIALTREGKRRQVWDEGFHQGRDMQYEDSQRQIERLQSHLLASFNEKRAAK